jgi:hypothetical protein
MGDLREGNPANPIPAVDFQLPQVMLVPLNRLRRAIALLPQEGLSGGGGELASNPNGLLDLDSHETSKNLTGFPLFWQTLEFIVITDKHSSAALANFSH